MVWFLVAALVVCIAVGQVLAEPLWLRDARLLRGDRDPEPETTEEREAA